MPTHVKRGSFYYWNDTVWVANVSIYQSIPNSCRRGLVCYHLSDVLLSVFSTFSLSSSAVLDWKVDALLEMIWWEPGKWQTFFLAGPNHQIVGNSIGTTWDWLYGCIAWTEMMIIVAPKYPMILQLDPNIQNPIPCHLLDNRFPIRFDILLSRNKVVL